MLSRFHLVPERNGQTDGRTDKHICYINIARQYADARYKLNKNITSVRCLYWHIKTIGQRATIRHYGDWYTGR